MSDDFRAEVYFLDVGQGTSQLISLGGGRAILIDGGTAAAAKVPLALIQDLEIRSIEALIVSHNDGDHQNGACEILTRHRDKVKVVGYLVDRDLADIGIYNEVGRLNSDRKQKNRPEIEEIRLERDATKRVIFEDERLGLELVLLYPNFRKNSDAVVAGDYNATSGILRLSCDERSIIFPGDATIDAWRWVRDKEGRIECDVLAVPHHGGVIWEGRSEAKIEEDLRWLYADGVRCEYAVISAGTSNGFGHPRREAVRAVRESATAEAKRPTVLCTQLTSRCCESPRAYGIGLVDPQSASLSRAEAGTGRSVACAGTILAEIGPKVVKVGNVSLHQDRVDSLPRRADLGPLCRP